MRKYILVDGEPVAEPDITKWCLWHQDSYDERLLAMTRISKWVTVFTVFRGTDDSPEDTPPALWETAIWGGPLDDTQEHHTSKADAMAAHERLVARAREQVNDPT